MIIPKLQEEVGTPLGKVNSILEGVDRKMEEFQEWVNYVKPTDKTTKIPMEIVNILNEIILDRSPATSMESVCERVEQLEGVVRVNQQTTEHVRNAMVELQEKVSKSIIQYSGSKRLFTVQCSWGCCSRISEIELYIQGEGSS